jgi:hypothetical protein
MHHFDLSFANYVPDVGKPYLGITSGLPVILEELQKSLLDSSFSWRSERCNFFIPMM